MKRNRLRARALFTGIAVGGLMSAPSIAFKPENEQYGHTMITRAVSEGGYRAWGSNEKPFLVRTTDSELTFSPLAVEQLVKGVQAPDFTYQLVFDLFNSDTEGVGVPVNREFSLADAHCDDNQIVECSDRIVNLKVRQQAPVGAELREILEKKSVVDLLFEGALLEMTSSEANLAANKVRAESYAVAARVHVGRALHTLQDFYAHSNWSDTVSDSSATFNLLGRTRVIADFEDKLWNRSQPATVATCKAVPIAQSVFDALSISNLLSYVDRVTALLSLVLTRVGLLDWNTSGGNFEYSDDVAAQRGLPAADVKVTTGFFLIQNTLVAGIESAPNDPAQCDHGLEPPVARVAGINKDTPTTPYTAAGPTAGSEVSPSPAHARASRHAAIDTKLLLESVIGDIDARVRSGPVPSNVDASKLRDLMIELFMGRRPVVAFVVDHTGSMQDVIEGLADEVDEIARFEATIQMPLIDPNTGIQYGTVDTLDLAKKFALFLYGETQSGLTYTTRFEPQLFERNQIWTDATKVARRLREMAPAANGGGDCREPTYEALVRAARQVPTGSKLVVYTDASSKNDDINRLPPATGRVPAFDELKNIVKAKKLQVVFSVSGSCSPIDPGYAEIARLSGGELAVVDHSGGEAAVAGSGIGVGRAMPQLVHAEDGVLAAGASKGIPVPVESAVKTLRVAAHVAAGNALLRDPAGNAVPLRSFLGGFTASVADPAPGVWTLTLQGGAAGVPYSVRAEAQGAFHLRQIDYASTTEAGRPGHEIRMPYGDDVPAAEVHARARLATKPEASPRSYAWHAVAEDGQVLRELPLARNTHEDYSGILALGDISAQGARAFRLRVSGIDASGQPFARMLPTLQQPLAATLRPTQQPSHWMPGVRHVARYAVANHGGTDQVFDITPRTSVPGARFEAPAQVAVGIRQTAEIEVALTLPADAVVGRDHSLGLTLRRAGAVAGDVAAAESSRVFTLVADSDEDGLADVQERGPNGNDPAYDGNGDGTPDWQQAGVISFASRGGKAYMTASLSAGRFSQAGVVALEGLAGVRHGLGMIDFRIVGLAAGGSTTMTYRLPGNMTARGYGKFGPTPDNAVPGYYDFAFDPATGLGSSVDRNVLTVRLKDGALGDDDLKADGVIVDAGGPLFPGFANAAAPVVNPPPVDPPVDAGGGGGGCTVGDGRRGGDATLALLLLLGLGVLWQRRRPRSGLH